MRIYALVYTYLPDATLNTSNHEKGFISSLYFSVITITTLGYGDILPIGSTSQLLTASESILGIIFIGLFLNSLSHQHGLKVQNEEKKLQKDRKKRESINRLIAFNSLIELNIERYLIYTIPITIPILNRNNTQQNN
ncbi:potassium channel family protein [Aliarcobacter butzleri]